jgi:choline dehydrogenase
VIRLASANPAQQALIDPKYLSDPEDLRLSIQGVRRAREILAQEPLRSMVDREIFPGPGVDSDEDLTTHVKRFVKTVYHPAGTCRMGRESDAMAVLSPDLAVRGVERLRVVDASAMPTLVSGNTNAAVLVIADKAVEFVAGRGPRERAVERVSRERVATA